MLAKNSPRPKRGYEPVFTVLGYYDGPRKGIASYRGKPHFFDCRFNDKDEYSEEFLLTPLDEATFRLAMESSEIFRRWELFFHAGKKISRSNRDYLEDTKRYRMINRILEKRLVTIPRKAIARIGTFKVLGRPKLPKGVIRPLQVRWTSS